MMFKLIIRHLCVVALSLAATTIARTADASEKHAVLIGVSDYPSDIPYPIPDLNGPRNDVLLLRDHLMKGWGAESKITVLADTLERADYDADGVAAIAPTKRNILDTLDKLAETVRPGDDVLVYFSGHGSQLPTALGSDFEEIDGFDETILPIDAWIEPDTKNGGYIVRNHLRDNTISAALKQIRDQGALVWLIVDACHSGTLDRSGNQGLRQRYLKFPPTNATHVTDLDLENEPQADTPTSTSEMSQMNLALDIYSTGHFVGFFAAEEDSVAAERPFRQGAGLEELVVHGDLTWALVKALSAGGGETYGTLASSILNDMHQINFGKTRPVFVGGLQKPPMLPWTVKMAFGVGLDGERLTVAAGHLHGVTPGTIMDIYRNASTEGAPLFSAEVIDAGLTRSKIRKLDKSDDYPSRVTDEAASERIPKDMIDQWFAANLAGMVARINTRAMDFTFHIAPPPKDQTHLSAHRKLLDIVTAAIDPANGTRNSFALVGPDDSADLQLWLADDRVWFAPKNSGPQTSGNHRSPSLKIANLTIKNVRASLEQFARSRNFLRVAAAFNRSDLAEDLEVSLYVDAGWLAEDKKSCILPEPDTALPYAASAKKITAEPEAFANPISIPLCSVVYVVLENTGNRVIDVSPFYFHTHGDISNITGYERSDQTIKLQPGTRSRFIYIETFPEEPGVDINTVLLGDYRLVLFLTESPTGARYTDKALRYIEGTSPASRYDIRREAFALVNLLNHAGYANRDGFSTRVVNFAGKVGAKSILVSRTMPATKSIR